MEKSIEERIATLEKKVSDLTRQKQTKILKNLGIGDVSHMSFEGGSLKTADGDIAVGKKCVPPSLKNTSIILRAASAGNVNSMDLWVENEDLFY